MEHKTQEMEGGREKRLNCKKYLAMFPFDIYLHVMG